MTGDGGVVGQEGDILFMSGGRNTFMALHNSINNGVGLRILEGSENLASEGLEYVEVVLSQRNPFVGDIVAASSLGQHYGISILAIRQKGQQTEQVTRRAPPAKLLCPRLLAAQDPLREAAGRRPCPGRPPACRWRARGVLAEAWARLCVLPARYRRCVCGGGGGRWGAWRRRRGRSGGCRWSASPSTARASPSTSPRPLAGARVRIAGLLLASAAPPLSPLSSLCLPLLRLFLCLLLHHLLRLLRLLPPPPAPSSAAAPASSCAVC